ncbi:hypothetical protein F9278_39210 [Streptomyces phaeolivaceus]|uniref:SWIM-type domain-containing protein n=1 Tax=Streptomyces phaeolivaceus TaxID=2653200 RepID=A0A5P8KJM9_9ACTN|nr:hypothetical protein F9278_39210 [Streptomyces phaeolivaceus]
MGGADGAGNAETSGSADGPDSGAGLRPADVARRALRAARERDRDGTEAVDHQGSGPAPGAGESQPTEASGTRTAPQPAARPGDVAREALRRTGDRPSAEPGDSRPDGLPDTAAPPVEPSRPAARPGDIAREALRAAREAAGRARAETEAARTEAGGTGAEAAGKRDRTPRRTTRGRGPASLRDRASGREPTAGRESAAGRDRASGSRAHEVRELLADVFKPPSDEPEPDETPTVAPAAARDGGGPAAPAGPHESPRPGEDAPRDRTPHDPAVPDPKSAPTPPGAPRPAPAPDPVNPPRPDTTPRVPRTMAAPSRDGELRRTFRPFPPRSSTGEAFAGSWWGNAWVTALEEGALDAARLARGRTYADKGHVDAITVTPGQVLAYVHGSRPRPYRVQLRLRTLDDDEWDRFLDAAAEHPGHIAALLDKELPHTLAASGDHGVRLLPGARELEPRCGCPDFGHPCKHAAALCYQTARLLDEDPFVLLLLRGRGERELIDALSRRNAARAARAAREREPAPLPGVPARDALAPRTLPPLPAPPPPPPHPEQPPVYPGAPGGPDPFALDQLATDAAARAHALLTTGRDPVAELTLWQDAVRLAAARPGSGLTATTRALYASLAAATGRTPADLARAVAAWRQGGLEGLAVLEEPWDPPAGRFDRARPLLLAADLPAFRPRRNHLTHPHGHVQLRLGRDGLWYAYESEPGHDDWWPRGTPDLDPVGALTGLGTTDD